MAECLFQFFLSCILQLQDNELRQRIIEIVFQFFLSCISGACVSQLGGLAENLSILSELHRRVLPSRGYQLFVCFFQFFLSCIQVLCANAYSQGPLRFQFFLSCIRARPPYSSTRLEASPLSILSELHPNFSTQWGLYV